MLTLKALGETPSNFLEMLLPDSAAVLEKFGVADPLAYIRADGLAVWHDDDFALAIGLVKTGTLMGLRNELWMLGGKGLKKLSRREWKFLRAIFQCELKERGPMTARVPEGFHSGQSFARFFGLKPTYRADGFQYYEVF